MLSLQDQIDRAASYIKQMAERVEELRVRKEQAAISTSTSAADNRNDDSLMMESEELRLPVLEVKEIMGSGVQVNLISKSCSNSNNAYSSTIFLVLWKLISVLHEEGAEVVSASFAHRGSKLFYTIHAQVIKHLPFHHLISNPKKKESVYSTFDFISFSDRKLKPYNISCAISNYILVSISRAISFRFPSTFDGSSKP